MAAREVSPWQHRQRPPSLPNRLPGAAPGGRQRDLKDEFNPGGASQQQHCSKACKTTATTTPQAPAPSGTSATGPAPPALPPSEHQIPLAVLRPASSQRHRLLVLSLRRWSFPFPPQRILELVVGRAPGIPCAGGTTSGSGVHQGVQVIAEFSGDRTKSGAEAKHVISLMAQLETPATSTPVLFWVYSGTEGPMWILPVLVAEDGRMNIASTAYWCLGIQIPESAAKTPRQVLWLQVTEVIKVEGRMSELSDEASESELLSRSLSMWHGVGQMICWEELDVPLDLHTASSVGQCEVVQECIQRGDLDLNKRNCGGWTPLMYASYIGHDSIVHLLLEAGVNVNIPTPEGQTPLMLASSCGNESVAYFLLQQGAELEMKDIHGWTALFHCTSAGHQQMVKFLLDNGANANCKEPVYGYTPLMEAAASGHEIIVQYLLSHGVKTDVRDNTGATARTLAMKYGHTKIVGLIDLHAAPVPKVFCRGPGKYEELSSSDESCSAPQRQRPVRRTKGPSIHDGPQALAKITAVGIGGKKQSGYEQVPPQGYVTFNDDGSCEAENIRNRDVTSPINEQDVESSSSREDNVFLTNNLAAIRSSSSSSECLTKALGVSSEGSLESNEDSDHANSPPTRKQAKSFKIKNRYSSSDSQWTHCPGKAGSSSQHLLLPEPPSYTGPQDLATFLEQIGCLKYLQVFEEQDVDLRIFLTLTESDLKEIGITLFGPKRKMTSAIARWHSNARPPSDALELAYADRLEAEMQELAIQLHKRCEEVEVMKGQVCQEQKLRAVAESCLMERDETWNAIQCQLREAQAITKDAGVLLDQIKCCQAELSSRLTQEQAVGRVLDADMQLGTGESRQPVLEGWPPSLKSLSLPELSAVLEERVGEMGKALQTVTQNLQRLQSPGQSGQSWLNP